MKNSKTGILVVTIFVLTCALAGTAQEYGGTVVSRTTGSPVEGVLVSVGHSERYTRTDQNGRFSISTTSIGSALPASKARQLRARWNFRRRTIDFSSAPEVTSVSVYTVSGKRVFGGPVPPSRVVEAPSLAKGAYLLELRGEQGLRGSARIVISNSAAASFTFHASTLSGSLPRLAKSARSVAAAERLIFRHDGYYPKDVAANGDNTDMSVQLKPDERSFVFDRSKVREYRFTIGQSDLATLDTRGYEENFVPATLTFEGTNYGTVGLRYKGSDYTLPRCFGEGTPGGLGSTGKTCPKISYKVKFTEYDKNTRFYGMKKIDLHALAADGTKMHDMLAYGLYREMGIHASRTSYANVYVNNNLVGLFLAVEEPDGRFTKSRWPDYGDGNLYKEKWPSSASTGHYRDGLKTNDGPEDNPNVQRMASYYSAIQASNEQNFAQNLSPYMDFDYFLRYMAVDVAINNWDGIRSWYSDRTGQMWAGNHNFYFYEEENTGGKIWLVPWDMDNTFYEIDPYYEDAKVPQWNETSGHCGGYMIWNDPNQYIRAPNCDKLTKTMAAVFWDRFVQLSERFIGDQFASQRLINDINTYTALVSESVQSDPAIDYSRWMSDVAKLKRYLPDLAAKFSNYLRTGSYIVDPPIVTPPGNGEPNPNGEYISSTRLNNFEVPPTAGYMGWIEKYFSENSTGSATHNSTNPLSGTADIRFDFTYRNTDAPKEYDVWGSFQMVFERPAILSSLKAIHITIRGDKPRDVRISLNNWDVYQEYGASSEYGWEIRVAAQTQTVTLNMSNLAYPSWAEFKPDIKTEILKSVKTLQFSPSATWGSGGLPAADPEVGHLQVDDIEFVY